MHPLVIDALVTGAGMMAAALIKLAAAGVAHAIKKNK